MAGLNRMMRPVVTRLKLAVGRAIVRLIDDGTKIQSLQLEALKDETLDGIERFQEYGFTSHPHRGAEAIIVSPNGMRQHSIVVAVDDRRHRMVGLEQGEVAVYTDLDQRIVLKRNGDIQMQAGKSSVTISDAGVAIQSGSLTHNGTNVGDDHTHGGVMSGGSSTSGPG